MIPQRIKRRKKENELMRVGLMERKLNQTIYINSSSNMIEIINHIDASWSIEASFSERELTEIQKNIISGYSIYNYVCSKLKKQFMIENENGELISIHIASEETAIKSRQKRIANIAELLINEGWIIANQSGINIESGA